MRKFALSVLTTAIFCLALTVPAFAEDPDTTPPVVTELKLTNKIFKLGTKNTPLVKTTATKKKKVPVGTKIQFTLDGAAYMIIGVFKALEGRQVGLECIKVTPENKADKKNKCVRPVLINTMQRVGRKGANSIYFSGILDGKKLSTGSYAFGVIASDQAGNQTPLVQKSFDIVKGD
jgi:hypothetical protein